MWFFTLGKFHFTPLSSCMETGPKFNTKYSLKWGENIPKTVEWLWPLPCGKCPRILQKTYLFNGPPNCNIFLCCFILTYISDKWRMHAAAADISNNSRVYCPLLLLPSQNQVLKIRNQVLKIRNTKIPSQNRVLKIRNQVLKIRNTKRSFCDGWGSIWLESSC